MCAWGTREVQTVAPRKPFKLAAHRTRRRGRIYLAQANRASAENQDHPEAIT